MTFLIRLKTGFFKTKLYYLTVEDRQVIMVPKEADENERLVIPEKDLCSVTITRKNTTSGELEIIVNNNIYYGSFTYLPILDEAVNIFAGEFGDKFIYQP